MAWSQNGGFTINDDALYSNHYLQRQARSLLATPDDSPTAEFVFNLLPHRQSPEAKAERRNAMMLYKYCVAKCPNCLCLKLFKVFKDTQFFSGVRAHSIKLLYNLFSKKRDDLHQEIIPELKDLAVSCLRQESSQDSFEILTKVVSSICTEIFSYGDYSWDELRDYIASTVQSDFKKAFLVVRDLPVVMGDEFLIPLVDSVFEKILSCLRPKEVGDEEWPLVFGTAFMVAVRLADSLKPELAKKALSAMIDSAKNLAEKGDQECLQRGVEELHLLVSEDSWMYEKCQKQFVLDLLKRMNLLTGMSEETLKSLEQMSRLIKGKDKISSGKSSLSSAAICASSKFDNLLE